MGLVCTFEILVFCRWYSVVKLSSLSYRLILLCMNSAFRSGDGIPS